MELLKNDIPTLLSPPITKLSPLFVLSEGAVTPIPTLPSELMRIRSNPDVSILIIPEEECAEISSTGTPPDELLPIFPTSEPSL